MLPLIVLSAFLVQWKLHHLSLKAYTDQLGKDATNQLTEELTTAKDNAVTELETYEEITTRNLKNQGDWAIEDLRESVTGPLDGLVFQFRLVRSTLIECQYFLFGMVRVRLNARP